MRATLRPLACAVASVALVAPTMANAATPSGPAGAAVADAGTPTAANGYVRAGASPTAVRVGTYNICKSTCGSGRHAWKFRRAALVNEVRWANPDVLALQEANTRKWHGVRQIDDVRRLLAPVGYTIANTTFACTKRCTKGAHIFYKPSRMAPSRMANATMPSAGMTSLSRISRVGFGGIQDRAVSWAFLTPKGSTRATLYVSVHMITQKTSFGERLRVATAKRMRVLTDTLVARSGLKAVAVVVAGDFNSYARRQPRGAQAVMTALGFHDGYTAPLKANPHVGTVNYAPKINKFKGFPPQPYPYRAAPTRIDYVFSTVVPRRHEVVVRLNGAGRFDERFRASDHNMVMVDLPVR